MQQQEQDPTNLYISNLPVSMDEQELESMLKPFGQVISTRILRDANGTSRGVGFARWESLELWSYTLLHSVVVNNDAFVIVTCGFKFKFAFTLGWSPQRSARP